MSNIIPRNSEIPITQTKHFTTASDYQEAVHIQVYEGERPMTKDNHFLGHFQLTGIPIAPRGIPEIDVTFDIDVNGILNVCGHAEKNHKSSIVVSLSRLLLKRKAKV